MLVGASSESPWLKASYSFSPIKLRVYSSKSFGNVMVRILILYAKIVFFSYICN